MAKGMETLDGHAKTFSFGADATYLVNFLQEVSQWMAAKKMVGDRFPSASWRKSRVPQLNQRPRPEV
ncbi:hypothetical protein IFR05_005278 [Cadophora sp. M221]|nr:hypothetical protein IFR05_005278 [Cadophora sp. M221]